MVFSFSFLPNAVVILTRNVVAAGVGMGVSVGGSVCVRVLVWEGSREERERGEKGMGPGWGGIKRGF